MTLPETSEPAGRDHGRLRLLPVGYDHPDALTLVGEVQQVYVARYGGPDETPVDPAEFAPPRGRFVVGYLDGAAAAIGGWRFRDDGAAAGLPGRRPAEIKRMFVRAGLRGRGLARAVLADLEATAAAAGADWLVLETGDRQPEAMGLYRSCGYVDVPRFGLYAHEDGSVYLGRRLAAAARAGAAG